MPKPSIHLTHQIPLFPSHWGSQSPSFNLPSLCLPSPQWARSPGPQTQTLPCHFSRATFLIAPCCCQSLLSGLAPCSCVSPSIYASLLHLFSSCTSQYLIPLLEDAQWIPTAWWSAYSFLNSWAFIIWFNRVTWGCFFLINLFFIEG